ncbi:hypothetical protein [Pseudoxanthomonas sp. Soil82]|uniref:hypothetical protein n=1 Tax=Pseudoxanthomonas sp. Soil82 TaxID=3157341 RepID=UPI00338DAF10
MDAFLEYLHRFWSDLIARSDGPMTFRFFLQPIMAALMAWRDGTRDARIGREPYWVRIRHADRVERLAAWRQAVTAVARILLLGVAMDVIYQFKVFGAFKYPVETFVIALLLALVPYLLLRGLFTRLVQRRSTQH